MKRLYRESMGRWRRTHTGQDGQVWSRDDIHWWNTTRREEFDNLACRIGETVEHHDSRGCLVVHRWSRAWRLTSSACASPAAAAGQSGVPAELPARRVPP